MALTFSEITPLRNLILPYSDENVIIWIPTQGVEGSPSFLLSQQGLLHIWLLDRWWLG